MKRLPLPRWTGHIIWFCPADGTIGVHFKLDGRSVFFTVIRLENLDWDEQTWKDVDRCQWVEKPPIGWAFGPIFAAAGGYSGRIGKPRVKGGSRHA